MCIPHQIPTYFIGLIQLYSGNARGLRLRPIDVARVSDAVC